MQRPQNARSINVLLSLFILANFTHRYRHMYIFIFILAHTCFTLCMLRVTVNNNVNILVGNCVGETAAAFGGVSPLVCQNGQPLANHGDAMLTLLAICTLTAISLLVARCMRD